MTLMQQTYSNNYKSKNTLPSISTLFLANKSKGSLMNNIQENSSPSTTRFLTNENGTINLPTPFSNAIEYASHSTSSSSTSSTSSTVSNSSGGVESRSHSSGNSPLGMDTRLAAMGVPMGGSILLSNQGSYSGNSFVEGSHIPHPLVTPRIPKLLSGNTTAHREYGNTSHVVHGMNTPDRSGFSELYHKKSAFACSSTPIIEEKISESRFDNQPTELTNVQENKQHARTSAPGSPTPLPITPPTMSKFKIRSSKSFKKSVDSTTSKAQQGTTLKLKLHTNKSLSFSTSKTIKKKIKSNINMKNSSDVKSLTDNITNNSINKNTLQNVKQDFVSDIVSGKLVRSSCSNGNLFSKDIKNASTTTGDEKISHIIPTGDDSNLSIARDPDTSREIVVAKVSSNVFYNGGASVPSPMISNTLEVSHDNKKSKNLSNRKLAGTRKISGTQSSDKSSLNSKVEFAFISHSQRSFCNEEEPDIDNAQLARRKRRRTSRQELAFLEGVFEKDSTPNKQKRQELANICKMSENSVQIWFQNKRQTMKKKKIKLQMLQQQHQELKE